MICAFGHDLLSRYKKRRFHHNSDCTRPSRIMTAFPHECSRRYLRSHYRIPLCSYLPGRVLILAQETLFTTLPTEPSVVHVCTIASPEIHFSPQSHSSQSYQLPPPSAIPTPSVHIKRPQMCYSMLSCSAPCRNFLCFLLMSLEQAHNGST